MRVVTWNCNGGLWKKFDKLSILKADIYIIQECENPAESKHPEYVFWSKNHLWTGDNKNKGIGIFTTKNIYLEPLNWPSLYFDQNLHLEQSVKYFLPCRVNNCFNLLGVWAHKNKSETFGYIGQFWKYLQTNKNQFNKIMIAGDFNSNSKWDQNDRW